MTVYIYLSLLKNLRYLKMHVVQSPTSANLRQKEKESKNLSPSPPPTPPKKEKTFQFQAKSAK